MIRGLAIVAALAALPAVAQDASPDVTAALDRALSEARADCTAAEGTLTVDPAAARVVDLGAGVQAVMVDESLTSCSTLAALRSGTGGWWVHAVVGGQMASWMVLAWDAIDWQPWPDSPPLRVLMLMRHGSHCNATGATDCVEAVVWNGEGFASVAAPVTED